jgi:hypothetical protein
MQGLSCKYIRLLGFVLLFISGGGADAFAQRVVFARDVDTSGEVGKFGPNRLFFVHGLVQAGFIVGPQETGMRTTWSSGWFNYGMRMKLKLWSWESVTMDLGYRYDRFNIRQKSAKSLPLEPAKHQKQHLSVNNVSISFCNRINFRRRGNVLGNWMEFGVYGDWAFRTSNRYVDRYYDSNSSSGYEHVLHTAIVKLPYIEEWNYGFTFRAGGNVLGFCLNYRVNELIIDAPDQDYPDLPKLSVGIELYSW